MDKKLLVIPAGVEFLSNYLNELPKNVIFDKGKTGCGGTTLAIDTKYNTANYIVAVPFINLAENKEEQFTDGSVFSYTGTTSITELKNYLDTHNVKKIMVTYDSLEKLTKITGAAGYNLLVDEYHLLFTQYSFRKDAVRGVLNNYKKFDSFTFMTATVLEEEFILDELKEIPVVTAEWAEVKIVTVQSVKCKKHVKYTVIRIVQAFLRGEAEGNAYIFVNSVDFIKEIIKVCGLTDENARAIWSKNNLKEIGLKRGNVLDAPKKINFLTSTCFEGVDIYDSDGKTFIVSDNSKKHTLTDISTSFQQIAGRIRNSKYAERMTHIYTSTRYDIEMTYEQYRRHIDIEIEQTKIKVKELNGLSEANRADVKTNATYITKEDTGFLFDANQVKIDLYNYKITKHLYKLRYTVSQETRKNGFIVKDFTSETEADIIDAYLVDDEVEEANFKDVIVHLRSFPERISIPRLVAYETAFNKYPFLEKAIAELDFDGIEALKYNITNIKRRLIATSASDAHNKIIQLLAKENGLSAGNFVSSLDLKTIFTRTYKELGIKQLSKASTIQHFYKIREMVKTINKRPVRGYLLISKKMILAE